MFKGLDWVWTHDNLHFCSTRNMWMEARRRFWNFYPLKRGPPPLRSQKKFFPSWNLSIFLTHFMEFNTESLTAPSAVLLSKFLPFPDFSVWNFVLWHVKIYANDKTEKVWEHSKLLFFFKSWSSIVLPEEAFIIRPCWPLMALVSREKKTVKFRTVQKLWHLTAACVLDIYCSRFRVAKRPSTF